MHLHGKYALEREFHQYKEFAFKNRMVDVAIAFIIGSAFQKVVTALTSNLFMPILNYIIGTTGNNWRNINYSPIQGLNLEVGYLVGSFIDFIIISLVLYIIYKKIFGTFQKPKIECLDTRICESCYKDIYWLSKKCCYCGERVINGKPRRLPKKNPRSKNNRSN